MKGQKGQGILEFAIILPLFLLLSIGAIFFGMMFADYVTINSIASRAAREASLMRKEHYQSRTSENSSTIVGYEPIRQKFSSQTLPAGIYTWDYSSANDFSLSYDADNQAALVTITARINKDSGFYPAVSNLLEGSALETLTVTYRMFSEENMTETPTNGN